MTPERADAATSGATTKRPAVSVLLATVDRPQDLAIALPAILASEGPRIEVLILDQSAGDESELLVSAIGDPRVVYVRCAERGKSRALNEGLRRARGAILAFTDDDCTVAPDWIARSVAALEAEPGAGMLFGPMQPMEHDPTTLFVPAFLPARRRLLTRSRDAVALPGVGANMFARRAVFDRLGGFDERLGPGGDFYSGEDVDLARRALRAGFALLQEPASPALHRGGRRIDAGGDRDWLQHNYFSLGATYGKSLRLGDGAVLASLGYELWNEARSVLPRVLRLRTPFGGRRSAWLLQGVWTGLRAPLDRSRGVFAAAAR